MRLIPIAQDGSFAVDAGRDDHLTMTLEMTVQQYSVAGFQQPWIGYLAADESGLVGICGFKSAPIKGRVKFAYGTLPGHEGKGVATTMAEELIRIVRQTDSGVTVIAQTLPQASASTSILQKLGFEQTATVEHEEDGMVWEWELSDDTESQPR